MMKQEITVSIIIPVYRVAEYLAECVESVIKQSYPKTEIILVDDGSDDASPVICDEYAALYSHVKVIHKINGGASDARNCGLAHATGEYVLFLDGDDFWDDPDALKELVERVHLTEAEVVNFSFQKYYQDTKEKRPYFFNIPAMPLEWKRKKEQLDYLTRNHLYISSPCCKLIKRTLFSEALLFETGVYSEDVEWSARLLQEARTLDFVCMNFYCYRQRSSSVSHTINDKKCRDLCNHIMSCIELYQQNDGSEREALAYYTAYQYGTYFMVQAQATQAPYECIDELERHQNILANHENNKKLQFLYIGCKLFGYKRVCKWIRWIYNIKSEKK